MSPKIDTNEHRLNAFGIICVHLFPSVATILLSVSSVSSVAEQYLWVAAQPRCVKYLSFPKAPIPKTT